MTDCLRVWAPRASRIEVIRKQRGDPGRLRARRLVGGPLLNEHEVSSGETTLGRV
jgi:hypothetical protein